MRPGAEGVSHDMSAESLSQRIRHVVSSGQAQPGVVSTGVGAVLSLSSIIVSATNTISAQQAIAMAVPAIVAITGGLIHILVTDSWTAWRRGFKQGCQAAMEGYSEGQDVMRSLSFPAACLHKKMTCSRKD